MSELRRTMLLAAREAETPEELGDVLLEAVALWHGVFWLLADVCRAATEGRPKDFVAEAARRAGRGHHDIYRWSDWSARVVDRDVLQSPITQARAAGWKGRRRRKSEEGQG